MPARDERLGLLSMHSEPHGRDDSELLAYGEVGCIPGNGARWPPGERWHEVCAYCRRKMTDEGKFHRKTHCIIPWSSGNAGLGNCLECGSQKAAISKNEFTVHEGDVYYRPLRKSPGAGCLIRVATCAYCGWWYVIENGFEGENGGDPQVYQGVLRSFDLTGLSTPIEVLRTELPRQLNKIAHLHPNRMEDLVGAVLHGTYDCEVKSLGYSKDGGIDLLVLLSDEPVAVQVKRRSDLTGTEGVKGVREFLGAALLRGHQRLLYVSTAEHFSREAVLASQHAVARQLVASYQLVDIHTLKEVLRNQAAQLAWTSALSDAVQRGNRMIYTVDPYSLL